MSVAISLATSAAVIGVANSAALQDARNLEQIKQCNEWMQSFDSNNSNKEQKQYYAQCVQRIYPKNTEMSFGLEIALKASVAILLIALIVGIYKGLREGDDGVLMWPILLVLGAALALMAAWGSFIGIVFILS